MYKKLANLSDLKEGRVKLVETKFTRVGLTNIDGKIFAFEDVCSHDGEGFGELELKGCEITCPRHLARFDVRTGEALCMPATEPLVTFSTRISGEEIEVDLEE